MNNYQEQAGRTNAELGSYKLNLAHMMLGISSELNELEDAMNKNDIVNISEEGADMFWYIANYMTFRDYNFNNFKTCIGLKYNQLELNILYYNVSCFSDMVKKFIAYGKPIDVDLEKGYLVKIIGSINSIFKQYDIDTDQSLQNNIDKLKVRFPEKFTFEGALVRDLKKEHEELSK